MFSQYPMASVIINNYNYENYVSAAIKSVLCQEYQNLEIIVVDDGSTDHSREIISGFSDKILPVFKANGGQSSALNSGFSESSGEIILFLDSDDIFCKHKIKHIIDFFKKISSMEKNALAILYDSLQVIDEKGVDVNIDRIGKNVQSAYGWQYLSKISEGKTFFSGDLNKVCSPKQVAQFSKKYRFIPYLGLPTSAISVTRTLADKIFPLPEEGLKISADDFLVKGASLLGNVYSTDKTLTKYRAHGDNNWYGSTKPRPIENTLYFLRESDSYLNKKYFERTGDNSKVFSFENSMKAKSFYRSRLGGKRDENLFRLSFKVIRWHLDFTTFSFFVKTLTLALLFKVKSFFQKSVSSPSS